MIAVLVLFLVLVAPPVILARDCPPQKERPCLDPVKFRSGVPGCWCYTCETGSSEQWTQCTKEWKVKTQLDDRARQGATK